MAEPVRLESQTLREEDIVGRRRAWFWRFWFRIAVFASRSFGWSSRLRRHSLERRCVPSCRRCSSCRCSSCSSRTSRSCSARCCDEHVADQSFEPGDAEWGVKLDRRSRSGRGEGGGPSRRRRSGSRASSSNAAGGKRERGCSSRRLRAPARRCSRRRSRPGSTRRSSRCPGSGFAATFIGIDAIIVRLPRLEGEAARPQVGWPVHRLHRRDRRGRNAPPVSRRCRCRLQPCGQHPIVAVGGRRLLRRLRGPQSLGRSDARDTEPGAIVCSPSATMAGMASAAFKRRCKGSSASCSRAGWAAWGAAWR